MVEDSFVDIKQGLVVEEETSGPKARKFMCLRLMLRAADSTFVFVCSLSVNTSGIVGEGDDGWIGINELRNREFAFRFSVGEDGTNARLRDHYEPGTFAVWTLVRDGSRVMIYRDGQLATKRPEYTSSNTVMNIGLLMGMRPHNVNFKGELAELLIFSTSLSAIRRQPAEQYLISKYGLPDDWFGELLFSHNKH